MPSESYHSVSVRDETYCILTELSKNLKRSIPETIHSVVKGGKFMFGILFYPENICLACGKTVNYLALDVRRSDRCPFCAGQVITRYVKAETRGS
jgi:DNA-directed RNA polymerase subunit RPC12/RpoP